jgi:4-alpha-glucanotransferase
MLPINETGPDNSPYNAISALALDPTTIALPGKADASGPVRYRQVKALKRDMLWSAFKKDGRGWQTDWLDDYTLYRALLDENGGNDNWESWPKEHQSPAKVPASLLKKLEEPRRFYAYVQRIAHEQWADVRRHADAKGVGLMGDIPFGVSRYSADVWANRQLFDLTWSGGAPPEPAFKPDEFTAKWGQNWGIPLYKWAAHRKQEFAWWQARVRQTSSICHLFRIDHVLGFYRIFAFPWRPQENATHLNYTGKVVPRFFPHPDDTPAHKRANCRQGEELLKMIQGAAGKTRVIAEDLGVVPDYVRPNLTKLGIPGFKIPYWERNPDYSFVDGAKYPPLSVVTPATHDHLPLAAHYRQLWQNHEDCRAKQDHHGAYVTWLELQRFVKWAGGDENNVPRDFTPALQESFTRQVLASNAWLAIFMITDVLATEARFNVPGPQADSNWTERLPVPVGELDGSKAAMFARLIQEAGR